MKFTLEIESNNAAFQPSPYHEIIRILSTVVPARKQGKLTDINGNVVGFWQLDEPELMIELYPMTADGLLADREDEVALWDVLVRPDGGDPIEEHEDLSYEFATTVVIPDLEKRYPEAVVDTQMEDLLR